MAENPYGPPQAPIGDERSLGLEVTGTFTIGQCLADAWSDTWAWFPLWLGVGIVGLLLMLLSGLTVIGVLLVWPVLFWGGTRFFLNMTDQRASFGDLFSGFSRYGIAVGWTLALLLTLQLLGLVGQTVQLLGQAVDSAALVAIGVLVNLVWAFAVMVRLYLAVLFLVDRGMGPIESLQASWEVTRGHTLKLVGLLLTNIVVVVIGLLALVVGVIPAGVMGYLLWTSAYRQLVGPTPGEQPAV
jgi:hypothetical protein